MKLAYLTGEYPRVSDTFIQREIFALRQLGFDVITCSMRRTDASHHVGPEQRSEAAQTFHVLEQTRKILPMVRAHWALLRRAPKAYFSGLKLALTTGRPGLKGLIYQLIYFVESGVLGHHLHQNGITHLHNHIAKSSCSVAMITSAMAQIPFSFTLHGSDIFYEPYTWRLDAKIANAQFVACISEFSRSQGMAFSAPEHWTKMHVIHCGVEPERYADAPPPQLTPPKALFVGRLATIKGLSVLLSALPPVIAQHPSFELTLIGDGPDRARLEELVQELGLTAHVRFVGSKSQSEVAQALAETGFFVLSSFAEGVPVVAMEAMAAARPVIAPRVTGVPELVAEGAHGYLVTPGSHEALSEAILTLLSDPKRAAEMGQLGRRAVIAEFDVRQEAARLATLFTNYSTGAARPPKRPAPYDGET